ncbi:MAG: VOC family protein [Betaproteobacteria bacterium]|nr:VOC family protein [Betaproteobacteria bacterium]
MTMKTGNFAWYDLMTSDTKAAAAFYQKVIGWDMQDGGVPDRPYTILSMGPANIGGLMPISEDARQRGAKPTWTGYILVDDVDHHAQRVKAAGGSVCHGPEDVPGVVRFAAVADPHGATFTVFKGMNGTPPVELAPDALGNIGWNELSAGDGAADFAFYQGLFGWTKVRALDMGPMGVYQVFATGGDAVGGMMTKLPETPAPYWLFYFNVDAIDAASARVVEAGGEVTLEPHEVPTKQWIVQCTDPQGARFAMVSWKR